MGTSANTYCPKDFYLFKYTAKNKDNMLEICHDEPTTVHILDNNAEAESESIRLGELGVKAVFFQNDHLRDQWRARIAALS